MGISIKSISDEKAELLACYPRLTQDFVAEKLGHSNFVEVCELDLPSQGLRNIDLGNGDSFSYLTRLVDEIVLLQR